MVVDIWVLIAFSQVTLLALVAAGVMAWRWRVTAKGNALLDQRCGEAEKALTEGRKLLSEVKGGKRWHEELEARLRALANAAPGSIDDVRRRVLQHESTGEPLDLTDALAADAMSESALQAEIDALRAELEAARSAPAAGEGVPSAEREKELKALVQQFTHDSREMLSCIQALEAENKDLRSQVAARNAA